MPELPLLSTSIFKEVIVIRFLVCNMKCYSCKNPNHKRHIAAFVKKYPSAMGRVPNAIILVDPNDWSIDLEHPNKNSTECSRKISPFNIYG